MLSEMFGSDRISKIIRGDRMSVNVDDKVAIINLDTLVCQIVYKTGEFFSRICEISVISMDNLR